MLDFIEERVNSSLVELATRKGDAPVSTGDGVSSAGPYFALFVE